MAGGVKRPPQIQIRSSSLTVPGRPVPSARWPLTLDEYDSRHRCHWRDRRQNQLAAGIHLIGLRRDTAVPSRLSSSIGNYQGPYNASNCPGSPFLEMLIDTRSPMPVRCPAECGGTRWASDGTDCSMSGLFTSPRPSPASAMALASKAPASPDAPMAAFRQRFPPRVPALVTQPQGTKGKAPKSGTPARASRALAGSRHTEGSTR